MLFTPEMFKGSFAGNKLVFEKTLRMPCHEIPVASFALHDPINPICFQQKFLVEDGKHVSAAFFAVLARGRPQFILTEDDFTLAAAFFAEHWQNDKDHSTLRILKKNGVGTMVTLVWKAEALFDASAMDEVRAVFNASAMSEIERENMIRVGINLLELGLLRAASQDHKGRWQPHPWVKQLIKPVAQLFR